MPSCKLENLSDFINQIFSDLTTKRDFAEPACIVSVATIGVGNKEIKLENIFDENVINYIATTQQCHNSTKLYFPLQEIGACRTTSDNIANSLAKSITATQHFKSEQEANDFKKYIWYCVLETINNIADHAQCSFGGYAAAQFFPTYKKAQVAIGDQGIGLLKALQTNYNLESEEEAIFKAVEKCVTGSNNLLYGNGVKNAGVGLFVIKTIIEETGGILSITSNDTTVIFKGKNTPIVKKLNNSFNGVLVAFEIYDDGLENEFEVFKKMFIWNTEESQEEIF